MKLKDYKCLMSYVLKKPKKIMGYVKFGYVSGTWICVNEEFKLVYVINPKVASTSIVQMLTGVNRKELNNNNVSLDEARRIVATRAIASSGDLAELQKRGYFIFTFVRNPYDRFISFYKSKFIKTDNSDYLKPVYFGEKCGFDRCKNFEDVLNAVLNTPSSIGDSHFMPQSEVLYGKNPLFSYDFIGKIESLEEDLSSLERLVGKLPMIPKLNNSIQDKRNTLAVDKPNSLDFFSEEEKSRFDEKFEADFIYFGYET